MPFDVDICCAELPFVILLAQDAYVLSVTETQVHVPNAQ